MATKKSQRIVIWIIAIAMAIGSVGTYFMVILASNNAQEDTTAMQDEQQQAKQEEPKGTNGQVDPSAHKVDGAVSELKIEDLKVGDGEEAKAGDTVTAHYKGTIAQTGVKFDSSYDRGEPATFPLDQVIVGWQEGIPGMKVGGKRRLIIPAAQAYGQQSPSADIPANSDLVFEVELLGIGAKDTSAQE